jgi:two-component system, cell cycle response regulator
VWAPLAERIRRSAGDTPFQLGEHQITITVSVGCAAGPADDTEGLVRRADVALYEAKAGGRNCAMVANSDLGSVSSLDPSSPPHPRPPDVTAPGS